MCRDWGGTSKNCGNSKDPQNFVAKEKLGKLGKLGNRFEYHY